MIGVRVSARSLLLSLESVYLVACIAQGIPVCSSGENTHTACSSETGTRRPNGWPLFPDSKQVSLPLYLLAHLKLSHCVHQPVLRPQFPSCPNREKTGGSSLFASVFVGKRMKEKKGKSAYSRGKKPDIRSWKSLIFWHHMSVSLCTQPDDSDNAFTHPSPSLPLVTG